LGFNHVEVSFIEGFTFILKNGFTSGMVYHHVYGFNHQEYGDIIWKLWLTIIWIWI